MRYKNLTGSNSRKLKRTGVDLLAGRADYVSMYPFLPSELGIDFLNGKIISIIISVQNGEVMRGMTLLELIIIILILGSTLSYGVYWLHQHNKKIDVESDTRKIYALVSESRASAFYEKEQKFVKLIDNGKKLIIDNDTDVNNGYIKELSLNNRFTVSSNYSGNSGVLRFDRNGFADFQGNIRIDSDVGSVFDCVVVSYGRIAIGKYTNNSCNAME